MKSAKTKPGSKYGKLTVLKRVEDYESPSGYTLPRWECECACGNVVTVLQNALRNGATKSCKCSFERIVEYQGKKMFLTALCKKLKVKYHTIYARLTIQDMSLEEALQKEIPETKPGDVFGRLTALKLVSKSGSARWRCQCSCKDKTKLIVRQVRLRNGTTKSCGCLHLESITKHNLSHHPLYGTCARAIQRCHDPESGAYQWYGGRGIKVYKPWRKNIAKFILGVEKEIGLRPSDEHSLDRPDNDKGYEPGNLRWSSQAEQSRNRRSNRVYTLNGETKCLTEWCEEYNKSWDVVNARLKIGWPIRKALKTPVNKISKKREPSLYKIWVGIKQRITNPKATSYSRYGGRGIELYEKWYSFESFREWITNHIGSRPTSKHTLDRPDNDGHYEPGNVRWATRRQQANNHATN